MEDSNHEISAKTRSDHLQDIRDASPESIRDQFFQLIPETCVPIVYLDSLGDADRSMAFWACLLCWTATETHMVLRPMQLQTILADRQGKNSLTSAGTGSGKTLPMAVCILFDEPSEDCISIIISPLKRLQVTQESDFNTRFGIKAVVINDDTPRSEAWWLENVWSPRKGGKASAQLLIVTVEQLFKSMQGHMPRLGEWIRERPGFQKLIKRINIDEAHFIYTAGQKLYGTSAFRPTWGLLGNLKRTLPKRIQWHLFSATFPSHILTHINDNILIGGETVYVHVMSNRPNIMYATHQVDNIENPRHYECFLVSPFILEEQPHVLIFVDNKKTTALIENHLNGCLPIHLRDQGVVKHYHSSMSEEYLRQTHEDFVSPEGTCRILVTTSGQSVGVDFPNVMFVCVAGLPSNLVDTLQRGGRAIRIGEGTALFVIFYEPWVHEIDLNDYAEHAELMGHDPDRPARLLTGGLSKRSARAPYSLVRLIQLLECIRAFFACYLNDTATEALRYTGPFCCERHNDGFNLEDFVPARKLYNEGASSNKRKEAIPSASAGKVRDKNQRAKLDKVLRAWLDNEVLKDVQDLCRPYYEILSDDKRKKLLFLRADNIDSPLALVHALDETAEWGDEFGPALYKLIIDFETEAASIKAAQALTRRTAKAANANAGSFSSSGGFIISTPESYMAMSTDVGESGSAGNTRQVRRKITK